MSIAKKARVLTTTTLVMSSFGSSALLEPIRKCVVISQDLPSGLLIGTHDGSFHCDEALAISMLKLLPEYAGCTVVRSRNPELLAKCGVVVDVGAQYDPATHRYDHHQREFTGCLEGYSTKLSSAGLVYQHFGRSILKHVLGTQDEALVETCFHKLYRGFVEHIDGIDNGISIADGPARYHVSTSLSARVGYLNPAWNEEQTPEILNARFVEAMTLTGSEFVSHAQALQSQWWPARSIVQRAVDARLAVHPSGQIIVLDTACPWKDHLFEVETETRCAAPVLYAVYQDLGGSWRIQAVPQDPQSFHSRKSLPAAWCGVRDEALSALTGQPGCIFIHASGFIGGHQTKEGALALAAMALDLK